MRSLEVFRDDSVVGRVISTSVSSRRELLCSSLRSSRQVEKYSDAEKGN